MYCVIVEPRLALFRYIPVAGRRFKTIVLSSRDEASVRDTEVKQYAEMGLPPVSHIDHFVACDTGSVAAMVQALAPFRPEIAAVVPADEPVISVTAELAGHLGLWAPVADDVRAQHIKSDMKRRFAERGVPTARFKVATSVQEAVAAYEELGPRCMVKMVDYASSMNVYLVNSRSELEQAYATIIENKRNIQTPVGLRREVLVEECVFGRELSVEGYVQGDEIVILNSCEKITEKNFQITGHFVPSLLSPAESEPLFSAARSCVAALNIRNSVFHLEVHLSGGRPYVIECAARPPGHHVCELIEECYGFDLMEVSVSLAARLPVDVRPVPPRKHFGIFILYSNERGQLREISALDELKKRASLRHLSVQIKPGDAVEPLTSPQQRYGLVLLSDATATGVRQEAAWFKENVRLIVEPAVRSGDQPAA